jgi:hypothetical protein
LKGRSSSIHILQGQYPDTKTRQEQSKNKNKRNYRPTFLINMVAIFLTKHLQIESNKTLDRSLKVIKWGSSWGCKND